MKKVYLAIPYNDNSSTLRAYRFAVANQVAAELMQRGYIVFSPISHSHPIAEQCELPKGFEYWQTWNNSFIEWCDVFAVIKLDGWNESRGVRQELEYAKELDKELSFIDYELEGL